MASEAAPLPQAPVKTPKKYLAWWLAAGLVGADIGTSVFYSTGVLFPHVGFAAPLFITFVAVCMWIFKMAYQEGCSVNPINGGAYSMVLQTFGRRAALVVGSLTILTYLATAVVSALSGTMYLSTLWDTPWPTWQIVAVAALPIVGFGLLSLRGLQESTRIVFGVAVFHFGMLIVMDIWGLYIALTQGAHWERLWSGIPHLPPQALIIGFAAAFLGITGFESASQIIEEIEKPTHVSIRRIYLTIVALVSFTGPLSSLWCMVLLSDEQVKQFQSAFLSGLALVEGGNPMLILLVLNACFTLFAAVNTAFAAATGLMTTMGKQGNLPDVVLDQWKDKYPFLTGYPFVALPFMALALMLLLAFPGKVDRLGEVYGMAFLGVMIAYCAGVVLLRIHQPVKVARSPFKSNWTITWKAIPLPIAPIIGVVILSTAEVILIASSNQSRDLLLQLFLAVLLVMVYYRLGQVENRMVRLPDLRLGIGRFRAMDPLPKLPTYVVCTSGAKPELLVTEISYLLKTYGDSIELVLFHAEERGTTSGQKAEELERLVSQQLEEFYGDKDFILSVKVLPGSLVEVLPEYKKTKDFKTVFITSGADPEASEILKNHLSGELGVDVVRLEEKTLPKGPGVWYSQWEQGFRRDRRDFSRYPEYDQDSNGTDRL